MSLLYVANSTNQTAVLPYQTFQSPFGAVEQFTVPPGSVVSQDVGALTDTITAAWAAYGIGEWSGSGVGWSTSPITL